MRYKCLHWYNVEVVDVLIDEGRATESGVPGNNQGGVVRSQARPRKERRSLFS
jgi:hypothetical protein